MHTKKIVPAGWPVPLQECPPGFFIVPEYPGMLCFKNEYGDRAFNCVGEYLTTKDEELVQPVDMIVEEDDT